MKYTIFKHINFLNQEVICLRQNEIMAFIPFDEANTDYQEYLKWLEEGNTPLPAEEVGLQPTADEISE
jgi:hypothetical protein